MRFRKMVYVSLTVLTAQAALWLPARNSGAEVPPSHPVAAKDEPLRPADLKRLEEKVRRAAATAGPSVVAVLNPEEGALRPRGRHQPGASGVVITSDGLVMSQWHVSHRRSDEADPSKVASHKPGEKTRVILADGRELEAELPGADASHDFSLLRLPGPGPSPSPN
jgi:S1-C subfamily serine protease